MPHGAVGVMVMNAQSTTTSGGSRCWIGRGVAGLSLLLGCAGLALAQDAAPDFHTSNRLEAANAAAHGSGHATRSPLQVSGFELVEIAPAGPHQRARRGLRFRWDGATDAVRSLGIQASDCAPMLRTTGSVRDSGRLGLSFALGCRF
jgi:hypothetical protein